MSLVSGPMKEATQPENEELLWGWRQAGTGCPVLYEEKKYITPLSVSCRQWCDSKGRIFLLNHVVTL